MNGNNVITTIDELLSDFKVNPKGWENPTLERYLEAMGAWLKDSRNSEKEQPSWELIADMLRAAKIYE